MKKHSVNKKGSRDFDERTPLGAVTQVGGLRKRTIEMDRPYRVFGRYALVYMFGSSGIYIDAVHGQRAVRAGDMICVFPDLPHLYGPGDGGDWLEYFLVFEGPVFDLWQQQGLLNPSQPVLHVEPVDYWLGQMQRVAELNPTGSGDGESALMRVMRLQQLLAELLVATGRAPQGLEQRWLTHARAWLEKPSGRSLRISTLASELHMSDATFRRRFTEAIGMSPQQYRDRALVEEAQRHMMHGGLTDREIAYQLGFDDPAYFSRRFKQLAGRSPSAYRRELGK